MRTAVAASVALVLVLAWAAVASQQWVHPVILPSPAQVLTALGEMLRDGQLFRDAVESVTRVLAGFLISVAVATPLGLAIGLNRRFRWGVEPVLQLIRPIPPIAWIPLAILWFGLGNGPAVFLTMIASFFPILINTQSGVEAIDRQHLEVARCFGASRGMLLRHVVIPAALPSILSGYRIGLGFSWMAVMAAEMISTPSGLGYLIHVSQDLLRTDRVLAGMIAIGLIGVVMDQGFLRLRSAMTRWT